MDYIAISGMMGSGKTTLARQLSKILLWDSIPESLSAKRYLPDLFANPKRWAFETQLSFYIQKALDITGYIKKGRDFILDRSLQEDQKVFFRYFVKNGYIEGRAEETYNLITSYFNQNIPIPNIIIYCKCPFDILKKRIKARNRGDFRLYPPNHLEEIYSMYQNWIATQENRLVYSINTQDIDFRKPSVAKSIAEELSAILKTKNQTGYQLDLFEREEIPFKSFKLKYLVPIKEYRQLNKPDTITYPTYDSDGIQLPYPSAYIAAPFTGVAQSIQEVGPGDNSLFADQEIHGVLENSDYKNTLNNITLKLGKIGINAFLPHRDINKWGERKLTPDKVVYLCTKYVEKADIFIGLLGMSHGSHYEFGIAYGNNKPCVLISCKELESSFIASGMSEKLDNILIMKCKNLSQIPDLFNTQRLSYFLKRFIPIE